MKEVPNMNAYEKIYEALTQGKDAKGKKLVDETIARFKGQGMTDLQAMKHAAMELNVEKEKCDLIGIFLKAYTTRAGKSLFNIVVDGETLPVEAEGGELTLPTYPTAIQITNANRVRNLMTKKTWVEIAADSEVTLGEPADPEHLMEQTKILSDVPDGDYALIKGSVIDLGPAKKDEPFRVTPEKVENLKLSFRNGDNRTGMFISDFEALAGVLPSSDDQTKYRTFLDSADWEGAVEFFNEVCGESRDFGIAGCDILVYGRISDNKWTDRDGNERIGKNVRINVGGFIYSVDLLSERLSKPESPQKKEGFGNLFDFKEEKAEEPEATPPTPPKQADAEVEAPDVESIEDSILNALNGAKNGLSPQELMAAVKVSPEELSAKLGGLHKTGKVQLKDGKFYGKKKK
jgi:single-stranded DNA-binding protein